MFFKFPLQQFAGDQQVLDVHKIQWIHCLFALNNDRKTRHGDFSFRIFLHYIAVGGWWVKRQCPVPLKRDSASTTGACEAQGGTSFNDDLSISYTAHSYSSFRIWVWSCLKFFSCSSSRRELLKPTQYFLDYKAHRIVRPIKSNKSNLIQLYTTNSQWVLWWFLLYSYVVLCDR